MGVKTKILPLSCVRELTASGIHRALKSASDPIRFCLDMLQSLVQEGVDPATSTAWERIDEQYQSLTAKKESFGKDVQNYRKRYSGILSRGITPNKICPDNRYDLRPAIRTGLLVKVST